MQPWFLEFAEAIDAGEGTYRRCPACDAAWLPPRRTCATCAGATLEEIPLPEEGTIESHTTITASIPAFADDTPYTIVYARFEPGFALAGQWRGADDVAIGDRVAPGVEARDDGWIITFEPGDPSG